MNKESVRYRACAIWFKTSAYSKISFSSVQTKTIRRRFFTCEQIERLELRKKIPFSKPRTKFLLTVLLNLNTQTYDLKEVTEKLTVNSKFPQSSPLYLAEFCLSMLVLDSVQYYFHRELFTDHYKVQVLRPVIRPFQEFVFSLLREFSPLSSFLSPVDIGKSVSFFTPQFSRVLIFSSEQNVGMFYVNRRLFAMDFSSFAAWCKKASLISSKCSASCF